MGVHGRQAGKSRRCHGDAVVGAIQGDDFLLFRFADYVEIVMQHFDLGIVGLTAGVGKKYSALLDRHHGAEPVRQIPGHLVRTATEHVAVSQGLQLAVDCLYQFLVAIPQG